jgi:hypothetical protein
MTAFIEQYRELLEDYFDIYYEELLERIPVISTRTYVLTILAICIPPILALIFYEREQARLLAEQPKGCRKLGLKIESNLLNEFDKKFSEVRFTMPAFSPNYNRIMLTSVYRAVPQVLKRHQLSGGD